ncbi:MAG: hypothetical protein ACKOET_20570 [Verrucomicrobiota bacterium]
MWLLLALLLTPPARAAVQFDLFAGYDNTVRSGGWFPVAFEIFHDGPGFQGTIELTQAGFSIQPQRLAIDLPTNTRKRVVIPMFSSSAGFLALEARLLDDAGKVRAEANALRLNQLAWETFHLAAAPGIPGGLPAFPDLGRNRTEFVPLVSRLQLPYLPDNSIALEGLNAIYLNSSKALELKEPQVEALVAWVNRGGHLILAIDQPTDITATDWLKLLVPGRVAGVKNVRLEGELSRWLKQGAGPGVGDLSYGFQPPELPAGRAPGERNPYDEAVPDPAFDRAEVPVAGVEPLKGRTLVSAGGTPLIVSGPRGRGLVTVLAFNPEREPLKSWKNRAWFWPRVAGVPPDQLRRGDFNLWGGKSLDGVFGSMVETRQVRKLPVGVLLVLLLVYLLVIGPFDQWWLRRINRPMLTWVTFPAYVALFSVLIYYIGFRLRAGNTEWNELHVVDVFPRQFDAELRGRVFSSLYSPANQTYRLQTDLPNAVVRPEYAGAMGGGDAGKLAVQPRAKGFEADVYVPVWSSQMVVTDWQTTGEAPLQARFEGPDLVVLNSSAHPVDPVLVIHQGRVFESGRLAPGEKRVVELGAGPVSTAEFVRPWEPRFETSAERRQSVFGGGQVEWIDDWGHASMAASLAGLINNPGGNNARRFLWPAGQDLSPLLNRAGTLVLAWIPDRLLVRPLNRFDTLRQRQGTLLRLHLPAPGQPPA